MFARFALVGDHLHAVHLGARQVAPNVTYITSQKCLVVA